MTFACKYKETPSILNPISTHNWKKRTPRKDRHCRATWKALESIWCASILPGIQSCDSNKLSHHQFRYPTAHFMAKVFLGARWGDASIIQPKLLSQWHTTTYFWIHLQLKLQPHPLERTSTKLLYVLLLKFSLFICLGPGPDEDLQMHATDTAHTIEIKMGSATGPPKRRHPKAKVHHTCALWVQCNTG